ncbi:MAG: phosphoribosylaminoimidazolesuccinocarboxamide synthase [Treponema sp.]|nr:phosphoribosylaminoimidazolesuccinocarboxamide synthase [Treponema sp.]
MELLKSGKTKDVYKLSDGNYLLKFKDTITGNAKGESDPGGNSVVGSITGLGSSALKMSVYYFELLKKNNIFTHYVNADISKNEMIVYPASSLGKGLEFIVRYKATGSFIRRFGLYCNENDKLPKIFEVTIKDDERGDPPITKEILAALNILSLDQYDQIHKKTIMICDIIKNDLLCRGLDLIDIKIEFGIVNGEIALIDEISSGNMRVYQNGKKLDYLTLSGLIN